MRSARLAVLAIVAAFIVSASPATFEEQQCQGWFDAVAGACDSMGD